MSNDSVRPGAGPGARQGAGIGATLVRGAIPYAAVAVGMYAFSSAWLAMLLYHAAMGLALGFDRSRDARYRLFTGWRSGLGSLLVAFGLGGGLLLWLLAGPAGLDAQSLGPLLGRIGLAGTGFGAFAVYYSLINPWLEERFWRGLLGSRSARPALADFLFAGYHLLVLAYFVDWFWLPVALVALAGAAWLWRQAAERGGGLAIPAASHLAADASLMLVVWLMLSGTGS